MADEKAKSPAPETANKSQSLSDIVKAVKATQEKQTDISEQETSSEPKKIRSPWYSQKSQSRLFLR